ncbi:hypothetical protein SLS57_008082 [Botryosphaeria dothidea]
MSGYEVEHNIPAEESNSNEPRRRPDLSTFYSALEQLDTSDAAHARHNRHALPTPADVISLFSMFRDALIVMSPDNADESNPVLEQIQAMIENPPKDISGVPDSFLDELERVPKKDLKKDDECAICRVPFLDGKTLNSTCPLDRKDLLKKKTPPPPPDEEEEEYDDMFG